MNTKWLRIEVGRDGMASSVKLTFDENDPLSFIWQEPDQIRDIIKRLEAALNGVEESAG